MWGRKHYIIYCIATCIWIYLIKICYIILLVIKKVCRENISIFRTSLIFTSYYEFLGLYALIVKYVNTQAFFSFLSFLLFFFSFSVLVNEFRRTDKNTNKQKWQFLLANGRQLFYHIVQLTSDDTSFYPPAKQLISSCAGILGQVRKLMLIEVWRNGNRIFCVDYYCVHHDE